MKIELSIDRKTILFFIAIFGFITVGMAITEIGDIIKTDFVNTTRLNVGYQGQPQVRPGDTNPQIWASNNSGIILVMNSSVALNNETYVVMLGVDNSGNFKKLASVSSLWYSASPTTGYSFIQLNPTYQNGGSESADTQTIRLFGNHGIEVFGNPTTPVPPGYKTFKVFGNITIRDNGDVLSGTNNFFVDLRDSAGVNGVLLGHSSTGYGVVAVPSIDGLNLTTFNGASWGARISIAPNGDIFLPDLAGAGQDFVCVDANGKLVRSNAAC